jgi:integrase/recombinase XerD
VSALRTALADYLTLRRALGFGLVRDAKLLEQFIGYLEQRQVTTVTVAHAVDWVRLPANASTTWMGIRMTVVRGFAAYLRTIDANTEVPPAGLLPGTRSRAVPYLYTDADIAALFAQAGRLRTPLRRATIRTLIGLLAVTGMRIGEVIGLDDADFDPADGILEVRAAKAGTWRQVPLHPSTVEALHAYRQLRDQRFPTPVSDALLVSEAGTRLLHTDLSHTYTTLVRRAGLPQQAGSRRARPHDHRHTFAVRTLLDWYRDGGDIDAWMPLLSTYLGHSDPAHTYWYIQASPELMAEAAHRLESRRPR